MPTSPVLDASVPIIGQPIKVLGYTLLPVAQCQCGTNEPLQLLVRVAGGALESVKSTCPHCQNVYAVQQVGTDDQGRLKFAFLVERPSLS